MPEKQVILLHEARMELHDIAAYHMMQVGPKSARKITERILKALDKLSVFPEMGVVPPSKAIAEAGFRILIVDGYLCFYQAAENEVFVYHIVHGGTDYIRRIFKLD